MRYLVCFYALLALAGCSQDDLLQKLSSPEDQATAKGYIERLRARSFEEIEKAADPSIQSPTLRASLIQMADLIPNQEPISIKVVGAQRFRRADTTMVNTTFEYNFGDKWLLANVAVQDNNGTKTIVGFNVNPIPQSLGSLNRFTLTGKNVSQYLILVAAILAVLVSLYSLVLCVRTKLLRRKWLWVVFILLGFGKVAVNWTTGEWGITPFSIQLLSASATAALYGPWIIGVSLPLGAFIFLIYIWTRGAPTLES